MRNTVSTFVSKSITAIAHLFVISSLIAAPFSAAAQAQPQDRQSELVQIVRAATQQYVDVNNAGPSYVPLFGCVSGPDHGAMGIHYLNLALVVDGQIDAEHPEALIYEPVGNKRRLVGVEYIVDAATWLANHGGAPPMLNGQAFQFVNSPNRYGIPAFFELHVWAWRDNPNGAFVDWNNNVSCDRY